MRERLIELIQNFTQVCDKSCEGLAKSCYRCTIEQFADYLIENGVVVLQCKIGDIVYQTDGIRIYELEVFDVSIRKNKPYYETESIDFDEDAIGKTVFLCREDAEKALKGETK